MSSRQKPLPYVVYHFPCLDGFGAAWVARKFFGDEGARYVPRAHSDAIPEFKDRADIYLLDITFKRDVVLALAEKHQIYILDHHRSNEQELAGIEMESPNIWVRFDMNRSGAALAWEHFFGSQPIPDLLLDIEDHDLWLHKRATSKLVVAAVESYEFDFSVWDSLADPFLRSKLVSVGYAIMSLKEQWVENLITEAREAVVAGRIVPAVNAPYFMASDVGHALIKKFPNAPFSAVYRDAGNGRRDWSFRSEASREDVSQIARGFGGGGHRDAAGMSEPIANHFIQFTLRPYSE